MTTAPDIELASDRWLTPDDELERIDRFWPQGIGLDPWSDPLASLVAAIKINARKAHHSDPRNEDAYLDPWETPADNPTAFSNSPYSGSNPARCARRIIAVRREQPRLCVLNLCIAAPGSSYWRDFVWPRARAIAWLGRLPFRTGVDLHDPKTGKLKARAGDHVQGNRNEIAEVLFGPERSDDCDVQRFRDLWGRFPVTVLRP